MLIRSIKLNNFLSFGPDSKAIELGPLNVLIGPNGSGKSNFLEAVELIRSAPKDFLTPIRGGGSVRDWLWKGANIPPIASIEALVSNKNNYQPLRYKLSFTEIANRLEIIDEQVENEKPLQGHTDPFFFYRFQNGRPVLFVRGEKRILQREDIDPSQSILAQRRDPDTYPELTYLGDVVAKIRLYREWEFGRYTAPRLPQRADMPNDMLESDCSNLGLVLNRLRRDPDTKERLRTSLQKLYQGIDDFDIRVEGGTVQVFFQEGRTIIPATRLSDGTLRYLCLLAILCHPKPPPLVCIEEPELGLHPDILPGLADLLKEASTRCQIIVTTHSEVLVDAMTDTPEAILVAEKHEGGTEIKRLDPTEMKPWLEKYRLGQLWTRGDIGGNRW